MVHGVELTGPMAAGIQASRCKFAGCGYGSWPTKNDSTCVVMYYGREMSGPGERVRIPRSRLTAVDVVPVHDNMTIPHSPSV